MNVFNELLTNHPELLQEVESLRVWWREQLPCSEEQEQQNAIASTNPAPLIQSRLTINPERPPEWLQGWLGAQNALNQVLARLRAYEQSILLNGGLPASIFEPPTTGQSPQDYERQHSPVPLEPLRPIECRFYAGTGLLRCAVNPCAESCNGCTDFEPRS